MRGVNTRRISESISVKIADFLARIAFYVASPTYVASAVYSPDKARTKCWYFTRADEAQEKRRQPTQNERSWQGIFIRSAAAGVPAKTGNRLW